jgi:hypothetical protein
VIWLSIAEITTIPPLEIREAVHKAPALVGKTGRDFGASETTNQFFLSL